AEFTDHEWLDRQPMGSEVRNPPHNPRQITDPGRFPEHFDFIIVLGKGENAHLMTFGKNANVVIHPDSAPMHMQHGRVGSHDEDLHFIRESSITSRSWSEQARRFVARLQSAIGKRTNAEIYDCSSKREPF